MTQDDLVWNVYRYSLDEKKIVVWNIFDSYSFYEKFGKIIKKKYEKDVFAKEVKSALFNCFNGRYEHEITICNYPKSDNDKEDLQVDVYEQVMLNFDAFIDYLYSKMYGENVGRKVSRNPQISG